MSRDDTSPLLARRTLLGAAMATGASLAGIATARGDAPQLDLFQTLNDLSWVADGSAGSRFVYVIYAPWCPYCKKLYAETRGLASSVQIRWIAAGSTNERARLNNIKIASSRDPAKLRELFASGDIAGETAAVPYAIDMNETVLQALRPTLDQLIKRSYGYPTLVFRTSRGGVPPRSVRGAGAQLRAVPSGHEGRIPPGGLTGAAHADRERRAGRRIRQRGPEADAGAAR